MGLMLIRCPNRMARESAAIAYKKSSVSCCFRGLQDKDRMTTASHPDKDRAIFQNVAYSILKSWLRR